MATRNIPQQNTNTPAGLLFQHHSSIPPFLHRE